MRLTFYLAAILGFLGLGVLDLVSGNVKVGVASIAIGVANALLLA